MKKMILTLILGFFVFIPIAGLNGQSGTNYYKLKTCTGIDTEGNVFDGSRCTDLVDDGPCDRESVCYASDEIIPY